MEDSGWIGKANEFQRPLSIGEELTFTGEESLRILPPKVGSVLAEDVYGNWVPAAGVVDAWDTDLLRCSAGASLALAFSSVTLRPFLMIPRRI